MEHNQRIALVDHELAAPPTYTTAYAKSLEDVCLKYSGTTASACWTEMAEVYAKTFGYDAEKVYTHCYARADQKNAQSCYAKGQTILSTDPRNLSVTQLTDICKFYKNEYGMKGCLGNIISSLMYYSPKFTERGLTLCQNITKYQEWCVTELGKKLSQRVASPRERETYCQSAQSEEYKKLCAETQ